MKTIKNDIKEQLHEELCYMYNDINESGGLYKGQIELVYFLCDEMLDKIPEEDWKDITKTFLDSTCGNGNFLVNIYERKLKYCDSINDSLIALNSIYGTELMDDNTNECRNRLYLLFKEFCDNRNLTEEQFKLAKEKCINILKHNIVCTDTFKWDYENWKEL